MAQKDYSESKLVVADVAAQDQAQKDFFTCFSFGKTIVKNQRMVA